MGGGRQLKLNFTLRYWGVWLTVWLSAFFSIYFFSNSIAQQLNLLPPYPIIGQVVWPNPQGNFYVASLYSVFAAFFLAVPFAINNPPEAEG